MRFLHNDTERFTEVVTAVSGKINVDPALVEKDYFVTLFLKHLAEKEPLLVFRGGTCLSKCFKIIKRFSEDIDIGHIGTGAPSHIRKKEMKQQITETIDHLKLTFTNPKDVHSGWDHNLYKVSYPSLFKSLSLKQHLEVETHFFTGSFPTVNIGTASFIYDYLKERVSYDVISEYGLEPFEVCVQALERTFVDKIFAVCDYYLTERIDGQSRHLYDVHKILPHMNLNGGLKDLIEKVRKLREGKRDCLSAAEDISLPYVIGDIMAKDVYRRDYNERTVPLLYETVTYADVAETMRKITDWLKRSDAGA